MAPARRSPRATSSSTYWIETLGCAKNAVDSEKLAGLLDATGYRPAPSPEESDVVIVNTCAFIEAAREESIETILDLDGRRRDGASLVATGCLAERHGAALQAAIPELSLVAGFGTFPAPVPVALGRRAPANSFDLLNLPRPAPSAPWAYLKPAEGCDRRCGFCAIPSFRGPQVSRRQDDVVAEARHLADGGVKELVVVAQDLVSFGRDVSRRHASDQGGSSLIALIDELRLIVPWIRLLYLYPSGLTDALIESILATGVPYFDLSLQHSSAPLLRSMRRWGNGGRFLERIERIRELAPDVTFRSSFIVGYPGEQEEDQRDLVRFLEAARLDWAGFFAYSREEGTLAHDLPDQIPSSLVAERLAEVTEVQDPITERSRERLVGTECRVLVDAPGQARSVREAPEIDGVLQVPPDLAVGAFHDVAVTECSGTDLVAVPVAVLA